MKINDYLSKQEIAEFTSKSNLQAWRLVLGNWLSIILIAALVARYPNPLSILVAIVLLGGRQLALSILMHDCGHRTLFKSARLNDVIGQWLCALPVMNDLPSYAKGHLVHHQQAGTEEDPDLPNYRAYPIPRASFKRKVMRDLSGQTGYKLLSFIVRRGTGALSAERRAVSSSLMRQLTVQLVLLLGLAVAGIAWVYALWVVAYLTTFMLFIRLRQIAEHAAVPDRLDLDPRLNTRTVIPRWWEKLLLAPNGVNYHLEHHFMASVPCYRLPKLHRHLQVKHALDEVPRFVGYGSVLRHVVTN